VAPDVVPNSDIRKTRSVHHSSSLSETDTIVDSSTWQYDTTSLGSELDVVIPTGDDKFEEQQEEEEHDKEEEEEFDVDVDDVDDRGVVDVADELKGNGATDVDLEEDGRDFDSDAFDASEDRATEEEEEGYDEDDDDDYDDSCDYTKDLRDVDYHDDDDKVHAEEDLARDKQSDFDDSEELEIETEIM